MSKSIQIRPLSFYRRVWNDDREIVQPGWMIDGFPHTSPAYGSSEYTTAGDLFDIFREPASRRWRATAEWSLAAKHEALATAVTECGIEYTSFERLVDLISALEQVVESVQSEEVA